MNEMIDLHNHYAQLHKNNFYDNILFSYQWWFLVLITVGLWITWAYFVDKQRLNIIILTGLFTSITALVLDDIGISMALWIYPYYVVPFSSVQYPIDLGIIPVFYMLLYQYFRQWKSYLAILTLVTLFAAFVVEPLFVKSGIYILLNWEHWYSATGYLTMGIIVKGLVDKISGKYLGES
ncbi:CBO0543 family protein [Paenisporosarcina sp. TG20]|uniref:CBO0543 family protein n=1 Tax=Paenisporosarcina sp. TG20 TaxID=1211706 RepID=UPI00037A891B|nr:CBO0543 family protein [Paenisporosarcina sp. TG20]